MALIIASGCAVQDDTGRASLPIVGGQPEAGFPAVAALGAEGPSGADGFCSGTLITPRILLTAAHCADSATDTFVQNELRLYFGATLSGATEVAAAEAWHVHPQYQSSPSTGEGRPYDVSVVILDADAVTTPARWSLEAVGDISSARSVGFGCTTWGGGEFGERRSAAVTIDTVTDLFLYSVTDTNPNAANICSGDSGGGLFGDIAGAERLLGVHSEGLAFMGGAPLLTVSGRIHASLPWLLEEIDAVHGSRDACSINAWYGDGVCDPGCEEEDSDCDQTMGTGGRGGAGGAGGASTGTTNTPPDARSDASCSSAHPSSDELPPRIVLAALGLVLARRRRQK